MKPISPSELATRILLGQGKVPTSRRKQRRAARFIQRISSDPNQWQGGWRN